MNSIEVLSTRIHDRLSVEWLTPSQRAAWEVIQRFDAPPHRVINLYGREGSGKTFLAWVLERGGYASYTVWGQTPHPVSARLLLDDAQSDRTSAREARPLIDRLNIKQVILLSRARVDERDMPAFELKVSSEDIEIARANLYRHLHLSAPDGIYRNYKELLQSLM